MGFAYGEYRDIEHIVSDTCACHANVIARKISHIDLIRYAGNGNRFPFNCHASEVAKNHIE